MFFNIRECGIQHLFFERKFQNRSLEWYLHYRIFLKTITEFILQEKALKDGIILNGTLTQKKQFSNMVFRNSKENLKSSQQVCR